MNCATFHPDLAIQKTLIDDGVMHAVVTRSGWVFMSWVNNKIGYLAKTVVQDFRRVEAMIHENRWRGWIMSSEREHAGMHKILRRVGGEVFTENSRLLLFKKEIQHV